MPMPRRTLMSTFGAHDRRADRSQSRPFILHHADGRAMRKLIDRMLDWYSQDKAFSLDLVVRSHVGQPAAEAFFRIEASDCHDLDRLSGLDQVVAEPEIQGFLQNLALLTDDCILDGAEDRAGYVGTEIELKTYRPSGTGDRGMFRLFVSHVTTDGCHVLHTFDCKIGPLQRDGTKVLSFLPSDPRDRERELIWIHGSSGRPTDRLGFKNPPIVVQARDSARGTSMFTAIGSQILRHLGLSRRVEA